MTPHLMGTSRGRHQARLVHRKLRRVVGRGPGLSSGVGRRCCRLVGVGILHASGRLGRVGMGKSPPVLLSGHNELLLRWRPVLRHRAASPGRRVEVSMRRWRGHGLRLCGGQHLAGCLGCVPFDAVLLSDLRQRSQLDVGCGGLDEEAHDEVLVDLRELVGGEEKKKQRRKDLTYNMGSGKALRVVDGCGGSRGRRGGETKRNRPRAVLHAQKSGSHTVVAAGGCMSAMLLHALLAHKRPLVRRSSPHLPLAAGRVIRRLHHVLLPILALKHLAQGLDLGDVPAGSQG